MNKQNHAVRILGTRVQDTTESETLAFLEFALVEQRQVAVFTPNTEMIMAAWKDEAFQARLNRAEWVIPDGIGLIHAARMQKKPLRERVTGFDTSVALLKLAARMDKGVFFLGGAKGVAELAKEKVEAEIPGLGLSASITAIFQDFILENRERKKRKRSLK